MSDDVFLKFEYDERDIWNGMRLRLGGKLRWPLAMVLLAMLDLGVAWVFASVPLRYLAAGVLAAVVLVTVYVACRIAPPRMFQGKFEATREAPDERAEFRDATMSIDASEDGIAVTVGRRLASLKWRECARLESDARCHVLFHGKDGFVVVPRRAFRNEKRDAAFSELASRLLGRDEPA